MTTVFLGGTANKASWRKDIKELLTIDYFDPIITDRPWTEDDRQNEVLQRETCDFTLYVLTPRMTGLYSIAEVTDCSNKRSLSTVLYIQAKDVNDEGKPIVFLGDAKTSLDNVAKLVEANGAKVCYSLQEVADYLNSK